jgi:TP901 family phage tail tape measure protein
MNNAEVLIKFKADDKEAQKTTKNVQKSLEGVSKSTAKYSAVASGVIAGISAVSMEFEKSMANVQAISGATAEDMKLLEEKAREMGKETVFSASESADALSYMALAGWKTQDMLEGLPGILNLAAAGNTDLATTSDIVTDALTAFGKTAKESTHLADIMSATMSNSNTNIEMLGQSFKYVASLAGSMNYSMEDTSLALGLMANSGIKADQAGTSLRATLTRLAKPTAEVYRAMEDLGISLKDEKGNMKSLRAIMIDLCTAFSQLDDEQKAQYSAMIAGKNAMSGLLAITNSTEEDFYKLADAIDNSTGSAQQMSDVMNQSTSNQLKIMWSEIQELALKMGEVLVPTLRKTIAMFTKIAQALQNMSPAMREAVIIFLEIVAALAPVTMIIAKVIKAFTLLGKAMTFLKFIGVINPFTLIIAGVLALVAGFIYLWNNCEAFRQFWINLWENIKIAFNGAIDWIKNALNQAIVFIQGIPALISGIVSSIITFIGKIPYYLGYVIGYISGKLFIFLTDTIPNAIINFFVFLGSIPGKIWDLIVAIFELLGKIPDYLYDLWFKIKAWFINFKDKAIKGFRNLIDNIVSFFKELPDKMWEIGKNVVEGLWNGIKNMGSWIKNKVFDFFKGIVDGAKDALGIHSPSKEFKILGKFSVLGYTEALDDMQNEVDTAIQDTFGISPQLQNASSLHYSPNVVVNNDINVSQDPLGQMVSNIKSFSGGAKNDYSFGLGE